MKHPKQLVHDMISRNARPDIKTKPPYKKGYITKWDGEKWVYEIQTYPLD